MKLQKQSSTGRSLILVPINTILLVLFIPLFFNLLNSDIKTIPLSTATPNNAMNPTPALMLKAFLLKQGNIHRQWLIMVLLYKLISCVLQIQMQRIAVRKSSPGK
jgi:hypothetical protein